MTSTTSRSSWSTGPSRSCPNDRRRVRRIRPEPRGRSPDRRALRERVSRGVRLRAESARPREPVGPPRHDRVRGLGCRRGGPAVPCSRHIPGRAVLLGPRDLGRDCLRARDVVPTRPHLSDQSGLDPTAVGPRSDLRPCPRLGLLDLDDRVGHQRDVVERLRSQRPGRADLRLPRARVLRLDVHFCDALRPFVSATPGLCVTGLAPSRVSVRFGLERTPILWITTVSNEERTVRPNALDFELVHTVVKFLRENPGTAVLLDDLDYLATLAGFDAVARFLKRVTNQASASKGTVLLGLEQLALYVDLRSWLPFVKDSLDIASLHGCRLFLTVAPEAMSPQELAVLARRFDTGLSPSMFKGSAPSGPTTAAPENRIPYREPSA